MAGFPDFFGLKIHIPVKAHLGSTQLLATATTASNGRFCHCPTAHRTRTLFSTSVPSRVIWARLIRWPDFVKTRCMKDALTLAGTELATTITNSEGPFHKSLAARFTDAFDLMNAGMTFRHSAIILSMGY